MTKQDQPDKAAAVQGDERERERETRALRCASLYSSSSAQQKMVLSYNPGLNYDRCQIGLVIADGRIDSDAEAIVAWNRMAWQTMLWLFRSSGLVGRQLDEDRTQDNLTLQLRIGPAH
ncbi:uncharacterized protein FSUBG_6466 [Fusarium subglutinans]|uniref:Uncharacterized protein n=1 Tax=Gibberella subglutinans TaxID=42677 RepID=A0A8H5PXQ1_GIBSU|nr:uncharacterized protein FSUBG_6466 [Fusarium subglutinans]KAF5605545.1 hypothetical protein FSUBG_6466 [Fusarium subglutinans]